MRVQVWQTVALTIAFLQYTNPIIIPAKIPVHTRFAVMGKAIECIYENNVLKPFGKIPLKEGERIRVTIEKKLPFEPIQLKKKPVSGRISALRDESWTSSQIHHLSSR